MRAPPPVGNWAEPKLSAEQEQERDAFLRLNPLGQVPCLIDPNAAPEPGSPCSEGLLVRESAAIATYLVAAYAPNSPWLPSVTEPLRAAHCAQWLAYSGAEVNGSLLKVRISVLFNWSIAPLTLEGAVELSRGVLAYIDGQLASGEKQGNCWLVSGAAPTIADVCVYPYVAFAEDSSKGALSFEPYPALRRWLARFKALPGYEAMPGL